ncbi:MAG: hypothetical protein F4Y12_00860 [Acidimicrobiaceae bacterium]|nr:hypothetical protein [Acidimicrobiaceae bacterium]MYH78784.1 hypothetical protein [Acidimicrobiaceae bacterium]MYK75518.1 hypothetical protein [Acidimicrobiaceae bacterium]
MRAPTLTANWQPGRVRRCGRIVRLVLLNYYAIAAAIVVGTVSGIASVVWIRGRVHDGLVAVRAAAVGIVGSLVFSAGALGITGLDGFTLIHVVYLVLVVGVPLAGAIVLTFARERSRAITALCLAAQLAIPVGIYATHIEPFWLRTDSVELSVAGVGERIRVGVLADLQTTEIGSYENEAVDQLIEAAPDMVLIPGDLYQFDEDVFDERAPQFSEVIQRLVDAASTVFLVSGNTDTVAGLRAITEGTGARVLDNEVETLVVNGTVVSVGGTTLFSDERAAQRVADRLSDDDQAGVRILLAHKPDAIELLEGRSVDLLVSGHTHGGQVSLPFFGPPLTLSDVPRHVAAGGLHELEGTAVYVSTGVGRERDNAPQLRFGVRPSIGIIDLVGDS